MRPRGFLAVIVAVLVASVLAACATIPRSGPVVPGGSVEGQDSAFGQIDFHPNAPSTGETQAEILSGFIEAAVSPENGYQIAREFLTTSFAGEWNPDASATVDDQAKRGEPKTVPGSELSLDISPVAFVDQSGDYRTAASSTPVTLDYSFVKQHGQWRISKAPDGIVINSSQFQSVFSAHALYFYSPDYKYLVPDLRWFPSSRAAIATRIVKALLAGPSPWLQGSVVTAFPKGAQLAGGSVVVTSGAAQVALSSVAGGADDTTINRMDEQLTQSLTTAQSISSVGLSIGGVSPQSVTGVSGAQLNPAVSPNALVYQGGKFGFLSGKSLGNLSGLGAGVAALHPTAATVTADASTAAVLAKGAVYAVSDAVEEPVRIDHRANLIAPSIDNRGTIWSATSDPAADFAVSAGDGATATIKASWPDARTLVAFAVSRDGTRLAALVRTMNGQAHLMVAGIVRDSNGHPTRLGEAVDFGDLGLGTGIALAWSDDLDVSVLGTSPQGGTAIVTQQLGGTLSSPMTGPAGAVAIAGGNPSTQPWVLTSSGELQTPAGNGWQEAASGVGMLAVQQGRD
ncbi:GerMN domain-containing protein [Gryllotalpicola reticulitermitis]|uniref:GerMN domain-containing protein n=1 Tax=Gryllotalpicola reticulitermitis TaxID=1184153 RepID=A0ABV8QCR8_9MICO